MAAYSPQNLLTRAENRIEQAARTALTRYLELARDAIIYGRDPDQAQTADASPADLPPDLEAWPDSHVWEELVQEHINPAIGVAFDEAFDAAARADALQMHRYRQTFMDEVYDRLSLGLWSDGTFERIRGDLAEALDAGDSIQTMQARISEQLQVDKHSYLAERIARTEAHAATEGGAWSSQQAWQEASGEELLHQWIATSDERTRPTHAAASGQRVPLDEPFTVGGASLQYPGDPSGDAAEIINCFPGHTRVHLPRDSEPVAVLSRPYAGPLYTLTLADGATLQATPNHPIATGRGWVAAADIEPADNILTYPDHGRELSEVFNDHATAGQVRTVSRAHANLHGERPDHDVQIALPARGIYTAEAFKPDADRVRPQPEHVHAENPGTFKPVVAVTSGHYNGPVYTLESATGWYIAHGMAVSNCRCSTLTGTQAELDDLPPSEADQVQGSAMPTTTNDSTPPADQNEEGTPPADQNEEGTPPAVSAHWQGILAPLGVRGDYRILSAPENGQVLTSDHMWLSWQEHADGGHDGKVAVGVIDHVWIDDGALWGRGRFDLGDEVGANVARKVSEGLAGTVSVDTNDLIDATVAYGIYDRDDQPVDTTHMEFFELMEALESGELRELAVISNWRLGGATLVQDPAFHTDRNGSGSAFIESATPPDPEEEDREATTAGATTAPTTTEPAPAPQEEHVANLTAAAGIAPETTTWAEKVASGAPMEPPSEWFTNPNLTGPTKVRVTDSGRVYGHIACWNTDHIGFTGQGVRPPKSSTNYAHYRRHRVRCADGSSILAGTVVMGTGHADLYMSSSTAMDHYDHTGYNVADVAVGEDRYGIWMSGSLKPGVSALQVLTLDRYSLSGDWRNGELVGVCVVNVPGFPIPEPASELALAASGARMHTPSTQVRTVAGDQYALVASGVVTMTRAEHTRTPASAGEASIVQAMQAFQEWMSRFDERMNQVAETTATNVARALRQEPEIKSMAEQVNSTLGRANADELAEASRMVNKTAGEGSK